MSIKFKWENKKLNCRCIAGPENCQNDWAKCTEYKGFSDPIPHSPITDAYMNDDSDAARKLIQENVAKARCYVNVGERESIPMATRQPNRGKREAQLFMLESDRRMHKVYHASDCIEAAGRIEFLKKISEIVIISKLSHRFIPVDTRKDYSFVKSPDYQATVVRQEDQRESLRNRLGYEIE
jgi:hypothetical protein